MMMMMIVIMLDSDDCGNSDHDSCNADDSYAYVSSHMITVSIIKG